MKVIFINESQKKRLFEAYDGEFSFAENQTDGQDHECHHHCESTQTEQVIDQERRKAQAQFAAEIGSDGSGGIHHSGVQEKALVLLPGEYIRNAADQRQQCESTDSQTDEPAEHHSPVIETVLDSGEKTRHIGKSPIVSACRCCDTCASVRFLRTF